MRTLIAYVVCYFILFCIMVNTNLSADTSFIGFSIFFSAGIIALALNEKKH